MLPSELRNAIYELVVFHYETGGIISPLRSVDPLRHNLVLVDGWRYALNSHGRPEFEFEETTNRNHFEERQKREALLNEFKQSSNSQSQHFCSPGCLLQPEVSKVGRQMREEALAVFYGSNHIHFEMSNFEVTDISGLILEEWLPMDWWRAIGDSNLRRIGKMSLVCHPSAYEYGQTHIMFEYRRGGVEAEVTARRIERLPCEKRPKPANLSLGHPSDVTKFERYRYDKTNRDGEFEASITLQVDVLKENGPHVQVLERIIAALEPCDREYLRDHLSLDDTMNIGTVKEGRGERALRWKAF